MRPLFAAALSLFPLSFLALEVARISLPDDFRVTMHHYASVGAALPSLATDCQRL